jgi:DNA-nicking Smr family endonuclease
MGGKRELDPEEALFAEAVADVEPLAADRHLPEPVWRAPETIGAREREALRELDRLVAGESVFELADSDEYHEGSVPGFDRRQLARLRRGEFTLQADLDLHGTDSATARVLIERFVSSSHARGLRCVRIVHGRGKNSPGGEPVLKSNLPRWLARGPARRIVLAYTSAARKDGGAGATYLLLRKR